MSNSSSRGLYFACFIFMALVLAGWAWGLFVAPSDLHQGEVYRIMYLHVPSAITAFLCSAILFVISVLALKKKSYPLAMSGRATAEVGFIFTLGCLATGSIWGKPTWGTWWTWDARLTTTFILGLLYAGYIALYISLPSLGTRLKSCAILGIFIGADVPIIYKSVQWWRTIHQPQSILRPGGGSTMEPEMLTALMFNLFVLVGFSVCLILLRYRNLRLEEKITSQIE